MSRKAIFALVVGVSVGVTAGIGQQPTAGKIPSIKVELHKNLALDVVARAPLVIHPAAMSFDVDGTLYVAQWYPLAAGEKIGSRRVDVTYRDGRKRRFTVPDKPGFDSIQALRDTDGDGRFDKAEAVLKVKFPLGVLAYRDWLYVAALGEVRRHARLKDGTFKAEGEVIARGFGADLHRQVSGLAIGPDGWLYLSCGAGDHDVEGSDGTRVRLIRTGAVLRCRPDGSRLHVFVEGLCNPFGPVTFDAAANAFHVDNDGGGGKKFEGCRLLHLLDGADYGWRSKPDGSVDPDRSAVSGERPGTLPPMLTIGRGGPVGVCFYAETALPDRFRNVLFYPDIVKQIIRCYRLTREDAVFQVVREFPILSTKDPTLRPTAIAPGPDGAIYLADWGSVPSPGWVPHDRAGRILRLGPAAKRDAPEGKAKSLALWRGLVRDKELPELVRSLETRDLSARLRIQAALVGEGDKAVPLLLKVLTDDSSPTRARIAALGVLQSQWNHKIEKACIELLTHPNSDLRRLAAEAIGLNAKRGSQRVTQELVRVLNESNSAVLRAMVLAIARIGAEGSADTLVNLYKEHWKSDRYIVDGILHGFEMLGRPAMVSLLNMSNSGSDLDLELAVRAFTTFRTRAAAAALPKLYQNYHLTKAQRRRLEASVSNYLLDPPVEIRLVAPKGRQDD